MSRKNPFAADSETENKLPVKIYDMVDAPVQQAPSTITVPAGYTPILIKREFSPEILNKINELKAELSTIKAIQSQEDADKANASLKKAKTIINTIDAARKEMTSVLDQEKKSIMDSEKDMVGELASAVQIVNGWVAIFQKAEFARLKAIQDKIDADKAAEAKAAQDEVDRKARVANMILAFEKNCLHAVSTVTLETIDSAITKLRAFGFPEETYKEKMSDAQSVKMLMIQKFEERKATLQKIAEDTASSAELQKAADEKLASEKAALEQKQEDAQMAHMEESANVAQNVQMTAEFRTAQLPKQRGVMRKWTFDETTIDLAKLPLEFHTHDKAKIKAAIAEGRTEIPGVRIFQDLTNVSR